MGGAFIAGDEIEVRLRFNNIFTAITGTPRIALGIGTATRYATYRTRTGGRFIFLYQMQSTDEDGDTEITGRGLEVSGGLRLTAWSRFRLEAQGRMLASYSEDGFRERGAGLTALLQPKADGEGLSFSLAPTWGGRGSQDALWRPDGDLLAGRRAVGRRPGELCIGEPNCV